MAYFEYSLDAQYNLIIRQFKVLLGSYCFGFRSSVPIDTIWQLQLPSMHKLVPLCNILFCHTSPSPLAVAWSGGSPMSWGILKMNFQHFAHNTKMTFHVKVLSVVVVVVAVSAAVCVSSSSSSSAFCYLSDTFTICKVIFQQKCL